MEAGILNLRQTSYRRYGRRETEDIFEKHNNNPMNTDSRYWQNGESMKRPYWSQTVWSPQRHMKKAISIGNLLNKASWKSSYIATKNNLPFGQTGIVAVGKNWKGETKWLGQWLNIELGTKELATATAIKLTMVKAAEEGYQNIILESDCKAVMNKLSIKNCRGVAGETVLENIWISEKIQFQHFFMLSNRP